ncbi:hypothetical protein DQ04_04811000 [Trypanosoma grayi]|uniref:hypothetical protein n=1 Tax=Trypanosoma grayi TaxID=71804 RepID=UPI0004F48978|nr:hypothetical protein DQ04_04811000 [Trypanosoma grayi]KEG09685.1 hypothetical protein DQ04_04811000 [Trypanosoma grayi]
MYRRRQLGLRDFDADLASLRQEGRQESRATRDELRRSMILEDVHAQNERQRQQQQQRASPSSPPRPGMNVSMAARIFATSKSVGCSDEPSETLPPWYEGAYTVPLEAPENPGACTTTTTATTATSCSNTDEEEGGVEDVAQRVAQAERTLYPALLAAVTDCSAPNEEVEEVEKEMCGGVIVEWDEHGAPLRVRSTCIASTPAPRLPPTATSLVDGVSDCLKSDVVPSGRTVSSTTATATTAVVNEISFDKELCDRLYAYNPKDDPLKSALLKTGQEGGGRRVNSCGPPERGMLQPLERVLHSRGSGAGGSTGTRNGRAPQLAREGTAVAVSGASTIAKRIRHAVLAQRTYNEGEGRKGEGCSSSQCLGSNSGRNSGGSGGGGCAVLHEPDRVEVVVTQLVKPVTAYFCPACGTCAARDVMTGLPDTCVSCGEAFEAMTPPPLPQPQRVDSRGGDDVCLCKTTEAAAGAAAAPTKPAKEKCTASTSTEAATTTTTTTIATATTTTAAGTQAGGRPGLQPLAPTVHGLYFLHLWDQATAIR